ncbi:hypothetical protein PHLCEN_2v4082 [Hermanssonia centrifuga]|uniref:Cytochrome P450 n=1 Tax=Hermanssonia centrifuga TaxID=98765 RepID=A0A2R6Q2C3_9APHY|nr:hypothetical protein PHLCEN_2v4082 [Hermanssonia centrifuga]
MPLMGATGLTKGPSWSGRNMHPEIPALIAYRDPAEHTRRRRPWNRAFSTAGVKEFQPLIANRTQQLIELLGQRQGQTIDLAEWIGFFTYGGWTEMMRDGVDKDGFWSVIKRGLDIGVIYEHIPWLSYYTKKIPGVGEDLKKMRTLGFARTDQRYKSGSTAKDLFYYLSNEDGSEKVSPPHHMVISDGVLAFVAGSDTTASVLSNIFWCLLRHPDVYKRLQAEVDAFYPPGENSLDAKHIKDMYYLEAVIYVPEGNQARIHFWSVHRDARNFSYPEKFWPERWLIAEGLQDSPEKITHNPNAFIPFSFGPSNCVGKNLALQEMRMLVCHFMQKLDARFPDGWNPDEWEGDLEDKLVTKLGHLPVIVERRD